MGQPNIEEIEAGLGDWELLKKLPRQLGSFKLAPGSGINGQILNIAAYVDQEAHCRLDLTYTTETFDYVPVKTVGLHTFRDERYFSRDREHFGQMLQEHLQELLDEIDRKQRHDMDYTSSELGFSKWDYWHSLPERIGTYERFISPDNPLNYINGSYIFLDYTDFAAGNQLCFFYNTFRNEIFAEMKQRHLPLTTDAFDVKSSVADDKKLDALSVLLQERLQKTLLDLGK